LDFTVLSLRVLYSAFIFPGGRVACRKELFTSLFGIPGKKHSLKNPSRMWWIFILGSQRNNLFLSILEIIESWHFFCSLTHTDNAEVAKCQSELKDEVTQI